MNLLRDGLIVGLSVASFVVVAPCAHALSAADADGTPVQLTELQFNSTVPMASAPLQGGSPPGWMIGAHNGGSIGVESTSSPNPAVSSVDALEGSYPLPGSGGEFMWVDYGVASLNTEDVYIEFWAEMPGAKEGCKFIKVFGQTSTAGDRADATIATDYTGADFGAIRQVSFGDGTTPINDTQNVININGTNPQWIGRSYGTAVVQTPQMSDFPSADWGVGWHHFRIHIKLNSGTTSQNEVPNGEFYLEIDGKVYVDATGLYNRNPADGPISYIEFYGWAQTDPEPFQLWYDDIRISTGGFMSQPLPDPPTSVSAQ